MRNFKYYIRFSKYIWKIPSFHHVLDIWDCLKDCEVWSRVRNYPEHYWLRKYSAPTRKESIR